ncbi:zinc-binding dehydrogenase [Cryptosporangium sp. NPDC051539]|uniref:zinc-binding dehydrogenase n=1 Tax=Cryptosporangium sp. NPDC051539 TaxID=3363962 RepID=UPI0037A61FC8
MNNRVVGFEAPAEPLRIHELALPDLAEDEAHVRVVAAGVCGSDVHRLAGDLGKPEQPLTLGHEGIGTIESLGRAFRSDSVGTPLRPGDRVYWSTMSACFRCEACVVRNEPILCSSYDWPVPVGRASPAAFQTVATLTTRTVCARVPEGVSSDAVIAFGCAMPTALGALRRAGGVRIGETVVIQGSGPVGLACTVLAALSPASRIIVIGAPTARLGVARDLGATDVVELAGTTAEQRREAVRDLTGGRGADLLIEAAGQQAAFAEGLTLLAPAARYVVAGLYSGEGSVPFEPVRLNNANQVVIGSLGYRPEDLHHTVALAPRIGALHDVDRLVSRRFGLDETEQAIAAAATGVPVKCVVEPGRAD